MQETTKPKPFCFVLMPFDDTFSDIYALGIKEACKEAGAYCERVDEQFYDGGILDRIYNQIAKADIIIADMTGRNPNVFYEVGYAHALGKSTILLTQKAEDIPFDLKHYPHIIYSNKILQLKDELTKRVNWYIRNPGEKVEEKLNIELFESSHNLALSPKEFHSYTNQYGDVYKEINLSIYNNLSSAIEIGDIKLGIIGSSKFSRVHFRSEDRRIEHLTLPTGEKMDLISDFDSIFPKEHTQLKLGITFSVPAEEEIIILRIFSRAGTRDFSLKFFIQKRGASST